MLHKVLTSIGIELNDSSINFYVYEDKEKKIEETNIKKFYYNFLNDSNFRKESLYFRVYANKVTSKVKSISDEDVELVIQSE